MNESKLLRCHGKMHIEIDPDLLERLESLEHLTNQHDILLTELLSIITRSYGQSISTGITEKSI